MAVKKYFSCKCGAAIPFELKIEMPTEEISISGRCPSCNASIHISLSSLIGLQPQPQSQQQATESISSSKTTENIEQAVRDLFKY